MDNKYIEKCIKLAKKAAKKNEVPIGALIIKNNQIISKAYNLREKRKDIMAHAEVLAIKKASKKLPNVKVFVSFAKERI